VVSEIPPVPVSVSVPGKGLQGRPKKHVSLAHRVALPPEKKIDTDNEFLRATWNYFTPLMSREILSNQSTPRPTLNLPNRANGGGEPAQLPVLAFLAVPVVVPSLLFRS
jgi:hypothetical protein